MTTEAQAGSSDEELHGSHVVEGVVQLLADGLVLQFLGIQLIYWDVGQVHRQGGGGGTGGGVCGKGGEGHPGHQQDPRGRWVKQPRESDRVEKEEKKSYTRRG